MQRLFVVPIEPLDNRYTGHWYKYLPEQIQNAVGDKLDVQQLEVFHKPAPTKKGEFLNFNDTIVFKNDQSTVIAGWFATGAISPNDYFLFTDAWNPAILQLRYLSIANQIPVRIFGIWHAGSYDKNDILGQRSGYRDYLKDTERALYMNIDCNIFATNYHRELLETELKIASYSKRSNVTGFPMEYYDKIDIPNYTDKENWIVFPHRKSKEKHPEIFAGLNEIMPGYELKFATDICKNKEEYHELLGRSKYCFSASDQETFGIAVYEAALAGSIPLLPNRLSYGEMWYRCFRYNDVWDIPKMLADATPERLKENVDKLKRTYFNGKELYSILSGQRPLAIRSVEYDVLGMGHCAAN